MVGSSRVRRPIPHQLYQIYKHQAFASSKAARKLRLRSTPSATIRLSCVSISSTWVHRPDSIPQQGTPD